MIKINDASQVFFFRDFHFLAKNKLLKNKGAQTADGNDLIILIRLVMRN
jgi:hypothetical protein